MDSNSDLKSAERRQQIRNQQEDGSASESWRIKPEKAEEQTENKLQKQQKSDECKKRTEIQLKMGSNYLNQENKTSAFSWNVLKELLWWLWAQKLMSWRRQLAWHLFCCHIGNSLSQHSQSELHKEASVLLSVYPEDGVPHYSPTKRKDVSFSPAVNLRFMLFVHNLSSLQSGWAGRGEGGSLQTTELEQVWALQPKTSDSAGTTDTEPTFSF